MENIKFLLENREIRKVLVVASGKGEFINYVKFLTGDKPKIFTLDKNYKLIKYLKEKYENIHPVYGNANELPFKAKILILSAFQILFIIFLNPEM